MSAPIVIVMTEATSPTSSEIFEPWITWVSTDTPKLSVPSGYSQRRWRETGPV